MDAILNMLSVLAAFLVAFGLLCLVQSYTLGFLAFFKRKISMRIALGDVIFPINALLIIFLFVDFIQPY